MAEPLPLQISQGHSLGPFGMYALYVLSVLY
jgi:hypothetical protein